MRTASNEKPDKCPTCGRVFINFCVRCARKQGKTPQEVLESIGLTRLIPYYESYNAGRLA
jgi:uncharacterized OB-fold protein